MQTIGRRKRRGRPGRRGSSGMTPMIDVTFLLLIFFVVATNFVREGDLRATLPRVAVVPPTDLRVIEVRMESRPAGAVHVELNRQAVALADLGRELERRVGGIVDRQTPVIIEPDSDVGWEHVLGAYNQVQAARFERVSFGAL